MMHLKDVWSDPSEKGWLLASLDTPSFSYCSKIPIWFPFSICLSSFRVSLDYKEMIELLVLLGNGQADVSSRRLI